MLVAFAVNATLLRTLRGGHHCSLLRRLAGMIVLLMVCMNTPPAWSAKAEELFQKAERSFGMAQFQRSLRLLNKARRGTEDPRMLAQIYLLQGLNYAVLDKTASARKSFRAALQLDPTLTLKPGSVKPSIIELFQAIRRTMKGFLDVHADQDHAEVILDQEPRGMAPLTLDIPVGAYTLKVITADGRWLYQRKVVIRLNAVTKIKALLEANPTAKTPASLPTRVEGTISPTQTTEEISSSSKRNIRIAGWMLAGAGVGGLITSIVLGILVDAKSEELQTAIDEERTYRDLQLIRESGEGLETSHTATLIAGSAILAVGAGLLIWSMLDESPTEDNGEADLSIAPAFFPGGGGIAGQLRF